MNFKIYPAQQKDIDQLKYNLRPEDEEKCIRGGMPSGAVALQYSFDISSFCFVSYLDDKVMSVAGCTEELPECANVWFMSSPVVDTFSGQKGLLKSARWFFEFCEQYYPILYGQIYKDFTGMCRLLKKCDFKLKTHARDKEQFFVVRERKEI
ncbi:MAG: hypothetical protein K9M56_04255 [Victivallales bacterium]|nr:hypothetical protein [Victivallales bacterium]